MNEEQSSNSNDRWWQAMDARVDATGVGTLLLRLIVGVLFLMNGTAFLGWFGGMGGFQGKQEFVQILGYRPVTAIALLLTITEIATSVFLILGFLTPLASTGAIGIGFNLIFNLGWKQGFLGGEAGPGFALATVLSVAALVLALVGPGRYSVDHSRGWRLYGNRWGVFAVVLGVGVGAALLTVFGPGFGGFEPPAFPN